MNNNKKHEDIKILMQNNKRLKEGGLRLNGHFKKSYKDNPVVTIITVTFNSELYLEETIKSIVNQTYTNIEYIIIDGGSTDRTIEIIEEYSDKIDYYVSEPDNGMYDALNKGFSCASGELINFCNSDDLLFSKNTIQEIIDNYNNVRFDCCYGSVEYIDNKKKKLYSRYPLKFKSRYLVTLGMPFAQPTFFWTKEMMLKTGIFNLEYKIVSDYDLIGRILEHSENIHRIDNYIIKFRKHGNSFGDNNSTLAHKEILRIKKTFIKDLKINNLTFLFYSIYDRLVQKIYQIIKSKNIEE